MSADETRNAPAGQGEGLGAMRLLADERDGPALKELFERYQRDDGKRAWDIFREAIAERDAALAQLAAIKAATPPGGAVVVAIEEWHAMQAAAADVLRLREALTEVVAAWSVDLPQGYRLHDALAQAKAALARTGGKP